MTVETKIFRNDTGLDFKRIEQIIKMFQQKANKQSEIIRKKKSSEAKQRGKEAFSHFGLQDQIAKIEEIDKQIELLKADRKIHEETVRDFTQGKSERYNTFDSIREGSPIHQYVNQNAGEYAVIEKNIQGLSEQISDELWLAKDINQAADIYERYVSLLKQFEE
ncbi:MAG: hypothetical protein K0Q73_6340 [Paenibacillus sp.]|jgi:hypothetical protein|nr:hypothetical protein [Paenibacillus sp.]